LYKKKIKHPIPTFFLVATFLFSISSNAQKEVNFDSSGYHSVMNNARTEHKPVFYMLYATWCSHCNKMKSEVFKDSTVANFMNKNFICAWQDIEKGEGEFFKGAFGVKAYPTFLFLDENETLLYTFNSEKKIEDFLIEAKNALNPQMQLPYLEKQFNDDFSNGDKCLNYINILKKGSDRKVLNPIAQKYLATQSDAQLVSDTNWKIIANGVNDIESRPFQYVLQHQKEFESIASSKRIQKKIGNIIAELLQPYTVRADTLSYQKKRAICKSINLHLSDSLVLNYDLQVYEKAKNWSAYRKSAPEYVEKFVWTNDKIIKDISNNYLLHTYDTAPLNQAIKWTKRANEILESTDGLILLSKLYQKINDPKNAILFAQKAKDRNKNFGFSTKEADDLLLQLGVK
jgi:thioredoxin-related protein